MPKKITIENLAAMVKRGFDQTATKDDLKELATKAEFIHLEQKVDGLEQKVDGLEQKVDGLEQKMEDGFRGVNRRIDLLREDISDLPDIREELTDLGKRMDRVEHKVGLTR